MKTKHTKGEWRLSQDWDNKIRIFAESDRGYIPIADVLNPICTPQHSDVQIANAKLIAAAPELLEALKCVLNTLETLGKNTVSMEMAKSAIKKATE